MTIDELRDWLKLWGRHFGERSSDFEDIERDAPDAHPLARARRHAPGTRKAAAMAHRRDGSARRRLMAEAACDGARLQMDVIPVAFVDHVPCRETRLDLRTPWHVSAPETPSEALAVNAALHRMDADCRAHALALRAQYGIRGSREDKAAWVAARLGIDVPTRAHRALVEQGLYLLIGRLGLPLSLSADAPITRP